MKDGEREILFIPWGFSMSHPARYYLLVVAGWATVAALVLVARLLILPIHAQTVGPSRAMIIEWNRPTYTFEPKDDITALELSKVLVAILPALACHNVLGCDPTNAIEALPDNAKRHFVKHGG